MGNQNSAFNEIQDLVLAFFKRTGILQIFFRDVRQILDV